MTVTYNYIHTTRSALILSFWNVVSWDVRLCVEALKLIPDVKLVSEAV